jgi:uncharacterized OB-fold protein
MASDNDFGEVTQGVFPAILDRTHADATTEPFWEAARRDQLVAARCTECGTFQLPPAPLCFQCRGDAFEWVDLPGTGTVYTFTVVRHPLHPALADACPYASGVIELDGTQGAGARLLTNIVDCDVDTLAIGDRVEMAWDHVNEEMSVPRVRPSKR